ncbi:hypothetical protein PGTUg99_021087 [Puccinia graminis f. sp. tritici]|uniref:Uncharacterized protein n=1 Tax=Puccinia graminis f. sp. tritici TaxID=56615 RepID=A0A5B0LUR3_PUCGR|nr:hypothetical protein PGTUg99_021087 [Puccinia graminis f. sp. tritici]
MAIGVWRAQSSRPLQTPTFNFRILSAALLKMLSTYFVRIIMVLLIQSEAPSFVEALDCSNIVDGNIRFPYPGCARILPDKVHFEGNNGPLVHYKVESESSSFGLFYKLIFLERKKHMSSIELIATQSFPKTAINAPTNSKGNPDCSGTRNQIEICCSQKGAPAPEDILIRTWMEFCRYSNGNAIPRNQG